VWFYSQRMGHYSLTVKSPLAPANGPQGLFLRCLLVIETPAILLWVGIVLPITHHTWPVRPKPWEFRICLIIINDCLSMGK